VVECRSVECRSVESGVVLPCLVLSGRVALTTRRSMWSGSVSEVLGELEQSAAALSSVLCGW